MRLVAGVGVVAKHFKVVTVMGVKDLRMRLLVLSVTGAGSVAMSPKLHQRALESAVVKVVTAVPFLSASALAVCIGCSISSTDLRERLR